MAVSEKRVSGSIAIAGLLVVALLALPGVSRGVGLNPASPGLPLVDNVYGSNGVPGAAASALCVSCHTSIPLPLGRSTHFSYMAGQVGRSTIAVIPDPPERTVAWTGSNLQSKYGTISPFNSVVGSKGELICESCHNLIRNVAGGNNILDASETLCQGCHNAMTGHHPMTGDPVSGGGVLSTVDSPFTRGFVDNTTNLGGSTSEVRYPGANKVGCLSCHANGHNGYSGTGARILRAGYAGPASVDPIPWKSPVIGTATDGAQRQSDKGAVRLISNWQPLCDACHKVDD